jgi:hypothetical protein
LNLDFVPIKQLPASLFQREAAVLLDFLKARRRGLHLALEITKEQLIRFIDALHNVLNRLATDHMPVVVLWPLLKFGDVFHQGIPVQTLAEQAIVPAMQGNTVVINQPTDIDLLVQVPILFRAVKLELVRFHKYIIAQMFKKYVALD